jgi:peroxiredoxin
MEKLNAGDTFPNFEVPTISDEQLTLPKAFQGRYVVLLFYRGGW